MLKRCVLVCGVLAVVVVGGWYACAGPALPEGLSAADYHRAAVEFEGRYHRRPGRFDILSWAGEQAAAEGQTATAVACFTAIPAQSRFGHSARFQAAQALLQLHRAVAAEVNYREFLELEAAKRECPPAWQADARRSLRHLLEVELRFEERQALLRQMIEREQAGTVEVVFFCFPTLSRWNGSEAVAWLEQFWEQNPRDFRLRVALGRYRTGQSRLDEAAAILRECVAERPDDLAAAAALLACAYEQGDEATMNSLLERLPPPAETDPWLLLKMRGHLANRRSDPQAAEPCYRWILQADPASAEAWLGLAEAAANSGDRPARQAALRKADILARIQNRLGWVWRRPDDPAPLVEIAELCADAELTEQARLIVGLANSLKGPAARLRAIESRLGPSTNIHTLSTSAHAR